MTIELNWLAVAVAAVAGYSVGAIWYMPKIFGNAWIDALGKSMSELGSPAKSMSITAVTTLFSTIVMALALAAFEVQSIAGAVGISALLGIGFYGLTMYSDSLFCGWSFKFVLIQAGHRVVAFIVMGIVLSLF